MINTVRHLILLFLIPVLSLTGCVSSSNNLGTIDELVFSNQTDRPVLNVTLRVPKTGKLLMCGYIPAKQTCSIGFQETKARGNQAELSWQQHGRDYFKRIVTKKDELKELNHAATIIIELAPHGRLSVYRQ